MLFNRKYRPLNFDSYIGNEVTTRKLTSMLKSDTLPHSCVFEGDRGCGKTTVARILGKTLLCQNILEDGKACDECSNCVKINEKFITDGGRVAGVPIQEIDVNSVGGKEGVLGLIEDMRTRPMGNGKKIYILDEIQIAGRHAQSALLKVLEEPSPWLYIFLCTTDPEDLLVPIRSRLVSFKIKRPTTKEITARLKHICMEENIRHDDKALELIVKVSNRIPRDSIKNLEVLATSSQDITYENVQRDLEVVRLDTYTDYISVLNKDIFHALEFINDIREKYEMDHDEFLDNLAEFAVDAFNLKTGVSLDKYTEEEARSMKKAFKEMDTYDLIKLLNLVEEALKLKDNPRYALVMLTLKMGFPEYFAQTDAQSIIRNAGMEEESVKDKIKRVKEEKQNQLRKEETMSAEKYIENKKKILEEGIDNSPITDLDIANMFEDSFTVE